MTILSSLRTRLSGRLGVDYPVFGFSHNPVVVAAICRAGSVGVLGVTCHTLEEVEEEALYYLHDLNRRTPRHWRRQKSLA